MRTMTSFPKPNRTALILLSALALLQASPGIALAQDVTSPDPGSVDIKGAFDADDLVPDETKPAVSAAKGAAAAYSAYAGRAYPMRPFFGDTHHHTANSGDAFMGGNRLMPEQAYRFARGEEVVSSSGVPAKLARPLDFLVISDHAEGLGVMAQIYEGNPAFAADPTLQRWGRAMKAGGEEASLTMRELISAQAQGTLPPAVKDPKVVVPIMKSVWQQYTATAEKFNEPGKFTTLIGYEWTSVPGGNNLHRNVIFRDNKDKADQILPFSAWQSEDPEKLWDWMDKYEAKTGGRLLAIPHNGNLSNGRMFELIDFAGKPLSKDYAERRARWEVLQEVMQTKGSSETHPTLSPNDEFADFGIQGWDYGNLTLEGSPETPEMRPTMYLRGGLLQGLAQEQKLGVNPFKFGFIGGTDVHNSLTAIEEDNFYGKHVDQEPSPTRWSQVAKKGFGKTRYNWIYEAAGYAGVWANENTRESLWDAMKRKETYATSGTRMTVRFFGGWQFAAEDAQPQRRRRCRLRQGRSDGRRSTEGVGADQGADIPRRGAQGPDGRESRPDPDHQGLGRQGRQAARADLRRRMGRREPAGPRGRRPRAARGRYGRRRQGYVEQHHRRSRPFGRLDGPRLRSGLARLLLRARHRDTDTALDGV